MAREFQPAFTFDDVLIRPERSSVEPREAETKTEAVRGLFLSLPILSAAMDRVTEEHMAIALGKLGGLGVLHRNCSLPKQVRMVRAVKSKKVRVAAACGPFDLLRAEALEKAGCDVVVIDCAHGHNSQVVKSARSIRRKLRKAKLVVGNIATQEGARDLAEFADGIKVGVGPGSICTTRVVSGVGVPQFSAILEVAKAAKKYHVPVIADGGIRTSGDIVKALAAGASVVMLGNLLAGTLETPGNIITKDGKKYKEYRGMGSRAVLQSKMSGDRYLIHGKNFVEEGVEALVPYRGAVNHVIENLIGGLRIGMGYIGAKTIHQIPQKAKFVYITNAGMRESLPHNVETIKTTATEQNDAH